jgi:hypothetical protein
MALILRIILLVVADFRKLRVVVVVGLALGSAVDND